MGEHFGEFDVNVWHVNCRVAVVETNISEGLAVYRLLASKPYGVGVFMALVKTFTA